MAETPQPRVTGLGIATLDYLFLSPTATPGGQAPLRDYAMEGGGLVATALVAAARQGAATALRSWIGEDAAGEAVRAGLEREGVDTSRLQTLPGEATTVAFIHVEEGSGERTIYCSLRTQVSAQALAAATAGELDCEAVLVDAIWPEASAQLARQAAAKGIPVVGDFCPEGGLVELAGLVTALIVPRGGAERLAPRASWADRLRLLADTGAAFVAITAGGEGCYYLGDEGVCNQPAFSVPIVDTTGAGDVFHGAFAYALGRRWPVARAAEFSAAVAALSCRGLGGRRGIPRYEETCAFLRANGSGRWEW